MFTCVLNTRPTKWAEDYYVYIESQAGFRANMDTSNNVFILHGFINHMLKITVNSYYVHLLTFQKPLTILLREIFGI